MGMPADPLLPDRRPPEGRRRGHAGFDPAWLATQRWTPERVRAELLDECWPTPYYELVDGELLVSPSPGDPHQDVVLQLAFLLHPYVAAQQLGTLRLSPSDVQLDGRSLVQPDLYVVPPGGRRRPPERPFDRLLLAVEVLSPSSGRNDRLRKRDHYARAGIGEYWLADPDARTIERNGPDARVTVQATTFDWTPPGAAAPLTVDVAALCARALGAAPPEADGE